MSDPPCFPGMAHPDTCWLEDTAQLVAMNCVLQSQFTLCAREGTGPFSAISRLLLEVAAPGMDYLCGSASSGSWDIF